MLSWKTHIELSLNLQFFKIIFITTCCLHIRFLMGYDVLIQVAVIFAFMMLFTTRYCFLSLHFLKGPFSLPGTSLDLSFFQNQES